MTPPDVALVWAGLAALNLLLAIVVAGVRPWRVANLVAAALIGANGVVAILLGYVYWAASAGLPATFLGRSLTEPVIAVNSVTLVAFIVLPWLFPRRVLSVRWERVLLAGAAALLLFNWVLLVLPGRDLTNGFDDPVLRYSSFFPFFAGLIAGTILLLDTYLSTPSRAQRTQALLILIAYLMKASTYVPELWRAAIVGGEPISSVMEPMRVLATCGLLVALIAVPVALFRARARGSASAGPRPLFHDLALLGAVSFGVTGVIGPVRVALGELEYLLFRPLLIAFGVLQFQLLEVDIRARKGTLATTVLVALSAVFLVGATRSAAFGLSPALATGVGLILMIALGGVLLWPLVRVLLTPGEGGPEPRARELYRAALEGAVGAGEGHDPSNERVLAALRARLQISEREHARMESSVRTMFGREGTTVRTGERFLHRYRVERLLGEGGFGRTVLARDETMDRLVVLKVARAPSPADARRLMREARTLARLAHPKIVSVFDVEEVSGEVVLVLEYVEGGSLADSYAGQACPPETCRRLARDVLEALAVTHAAGIVHRDLKPENILIGNDGRAKLSDFGVAGLPPGSGTESAFTPGGEHPGSLRYMSPEQIRGLPLDGRSDLYALGAVLFELLACKPYLDLQRKNGFDARLAILSAPVPLPVRGIPTEWNAFLARLLSKDPAGRPADAATALEELFRLPVVVRPASPRTRRRRQAAPS